jgi:amidophosphoribosyltransferase
LILKLKEECGVFGVSNAKDASALTALGLHALQHRGQEGCGIVTFDGEKYYSEKRFGLVGDNLIKKKSLKTLKEIMLLVITDTVLLVKTP